MEVLNSNRLFSIDHDPDTNTLLVRFRVVSGPGSLYHYAGVPPEVFSRFCESEDKDQFASDYIYGKYPHQKIAELRT